ncbi:MAG: hypothetical protein RLZZ50_206 [Verrucomicrobiota bacterium]
MRPPIRAGSAEAQSLGQATPATQAVVFWAVWFSLTSGVVVLHVLLRPTPARPGAALGGFGPIEWICVGLVVVSAALRWLLLPRLGTLPAKLPVFIVACAMAEACGILSLFLSPAHHRELFFVSLLGLLTLAPVFALPRPSGFPRAEG